MYLTHLSSRAALRRKTSTVIASVITSYCCWFRDSHFCGKRIKDNCGNLPYGPFPVISRPPKLFRNAFSEPHRPNLSQFFHPTIARGAQRQNGAFNASTKQWLPSFDPLWSRRELEYNFLKPGRESKMFNSHCRMCWRISGPAPIARSH